jgi:two-component system, NtrC family, sensor kinase
MDTRPISWWNRLGVKLAVAITVVSVLTFGVFLALVLRSQRRHLLEQARHTAAVVSDTINASIHYDMLHDRRHEAYLIMRAIGAQHQVERLRIFDASGRVRFSADAAEVGEVPDLTSSSCSPCHGEGKAQLPLSIRERTHVAVRNGHQVLGAVTPIYNEPSCSNSDCHVHRPDQRVIGVIELGMRLDAIEREGGALTESTLWISLVSALLLGTLTFVFTRTLVVRPVGRLVQGTHQVGAGDLTQRVPIQGTGELAVLQASFNEMGTALEATRAERDALLAGLEQQVKERTDALERAQQRLIQTEKLSSLGRLSASIAHEINNPLAGILTTAKLLIRTVGDRGDDPTAAWIVKQLGLVQRETERCAAIVGNLLGFARERPLALTDTDVNVALDEALFLVQNQIALQNIVLERQLASVPPVRADLGQLRQAFANILLNACDAMPNRGTLRVRSRVLAQDHVLEVSIADTGVGIPPEQLSNVLDPFFTTKEKGTGLGLSVVYGVVERHGGRLSIDSEPGAGTTVTIWLPLVSADGRPAGAPAEPAHGGA